MLCTNVVLNVKTKTNKQTKFCTHHVLNLYFSCNSMNNLSSYCGLTDSRMRASDKDLPVPIDLKECKFKLMQKLTKYPVNI